MITFDSKTCPADGLQCLSSVTSFRRQILRCYHKPHSYKAYKLTKVIYPRSTFTG